VTKEQNLDEGAAMPESLNVCFVPRARRRKRSVATTVRRRVSFLLIF